MIKKIKYTFCRSRQLLVRLANAIEFKNKQQPRLMKTDVVDCSVGLLKDDCSSGCWMSVFVAGVGCGL